MSNEKNPRATTAELLRIFDAWYPPHPALTQMDDYTEYGDGPPETWPHQDDDMPPSSKPAKHRRPQK